MVSKEDIENVFGELLSKISDSDLREKVVEVWLIAAERGGWNDIEKMKKIPFSLLTDTKGINLFEHTIAVTKGALGLARAQEETYSSLPYKIDFDRLIAGGLLHDVGKLLEVEPDGKRGHIKSHSGRCARHPISGAAIAYEVGLPMEIVNIIACHSKEGEGRPQVVETGFIHQADFAAFNPLLMLGKGLLIQEE